MGSDEARKSRWGLVLPDEDEMPEMTEPVIVARFVCSGVHVAVHGGMVLFDAWENLQTINGAERRVVGRSAMTVETAHEMVDTLLEKLPPRR